MWGLMIARIKGHLDFKKQQKKFTILSWILEMFCQVTAERIFTSFLLGLQLSSFILHVDPVSSPND